MERVLQLLREYSEAQRQREHERGPLIVLHSPNLPETAPEEIERARRANRFPIVHVWFCTPKKLGHKRGTDSPEPA